MKKPRFYSISPATRAVSVLAALLAGATLLAGCQNSEGLLAEDTPELLEPIDLQVDTYTVDRRDVYHVAAYETDVIPKLTELSFASAGLLEEFCYYIGDSVTEGTILARLEGSSSQYDSLTAQYESLVESNAYNNRLTEIDIEIAKLRGEDTTRDELCYRQELELQQLELDRLQGQIDEAESSIASAQIVAPCDGVIVALADLSSGDAITAESPVIALASSDHAYVTCNYYTEEEIAAADRIYLKVNSEEYELTYLPYEDDAVLAEALTAGTALSTFEVNGDPEALIGSYGLIYIITDLQEDVISVPINALYRDGNTYYVYVMDGDSRIQTEVEIGIIGTMYAQVLSGVEEGAQLYVKE